MVQKYYFQMALIQSGLMFLEQLLVLMMEPHQEPVQKFAAR